jgi:hypothetical protein
MTRVTIRVFRIQDASDFAAHSKAVVGWVGRGNVGVDILHVCLNLDEDAHGHGFDVLTAHHAEGCIITDIATARERAAWATKP